MPDRAVIVGRAGSELAVECGSVEADVLLDVVPSRALSAHVERKGQILASALLGLTLIPQHNTGLVQIPHDGGVRATRSISDLFGAMPGCIHRENQPDRVRR